MAEAEAGRTRTATEAAGGEGLWEGASPSQGGAVPRPLPRRARARAAHAEAVH